MTTLTRTTYAAEALSTGEGRRGHVRTTDGVLDLDLAAPKEMGGSGAGANPELLFAAGYAACFHSALLGIARTEKLELTGSSVGARVRIGPAPDGGYALAVDLEVVLPGLDADRAQALAEAAHQACPYSRATRGNIDVSVTVGED